MKKTEERGRRLKKNLRWKSSKKIDEENTPLSHRQIQATFRTPLASPQRIQAGLRLALFLLHVFALLP
jgi:hypothetical protein